jgi:hypothetical protein
VGCEALRSLGSPGRTAKGSLVVQLVRTGDVTLDVLAMLAEFIRPLG